MTDVDQGGEVTVSSDEITAYQTFQPDEFEVPTVGLKLVSDRDEVAHVELAVDLPPELNIEEVGFHPDYGRDSWSVSDGTMAYETDIQPGEEVTTMYTVESVRSAEIEALLSNLSVETVEDKEQDVVENDESKAETAGGGEPGKAAETAHDQSDETETSSGAESETAAKRETRVIGDGEAPTEASDNLSAYPTADLLSELARRESMDDLSATDRDRLQEFASETDESLEVRVSHLQKRMSDIEAYTDQVERLYEEYGDPNETYEGFDNQLDEFANQLAAVESDIERLQNDIESVKQGQSELESKVSEEIESVKQRQSDVESEITDLSEWRKSVTSALDALTGK